MCRNFHNSLTQNSEKLGKTECPSTSKWLDKYVYIYLMDYVSAIKMKCVLIYSIQRINYSNQILLKSIKNIRALLCNYICVLWKQAVPNFKSQEWDSLG